MRFILTLGCLLLAQSGSDLYEAAVKKFGDRSYKISEHGKLFGMCTLKSRIAEEGGARLAIFEDRIEKAGDKPVILDYIEKASLRGLKLRWATRVDGGPKEDDPKIVIEDGDARVTTDQGNSLLKKVEGAIGERALIRLICMAEPKVGMSMPLDLLVLDPVDYQRKQEIRCVAAETIDVAGRKTETFKWVDKREGTSILSGEPVPYKVDNTYWVSKEGVLVKFTTGSMEMVLDSK